MVAGMNALPKPRPSSSQNVGSTMNIVPVTNIRSMSPKALFSPTSGSKLVCGRFQPNPSRRAHPGSSNRSSAQLEPEIDEEQRELHDAHGNDRLQVVGAYDQHKRDADDQRHLEQGEHHGQRLSHDVHGGNAAIAPTAIPTSPWPASRCSAGSCRSGRRSPYRRCPGSISAAAARRWRGSPSRPPRPAQNPAQPTARRFSRLGSTCPSRRAADHCCHRPTTACRTDSRHRWPPAQAPRRGCCRKASHRAVCWSGRCRSSRPCP